MKILICATLILGVCSLQTAIAAESQPAQSQGQGQSSKPQPVELTGVNIDQCDKVCKTAHKDVNIISDGTVLFDKQTGQAYCGCAAIKLQQ